MRAVLAALPLILWILAMVVVCVAGAALFGCAPTLVQRPQLTSSISVAYEVLAVDRLNDRQVKFVTVYAQVERVGCHAEAILTNGRVVVFPEAPGTTQSFPLPFGVGRHEVKVLAVCEGIAVAQQPHWFTVWPEVAE